MLTSPTSDTSPPPLELVIDALATYRLTRLATADVISEPLRRRILGRALGWSTEEVTRAAPSAQELVDDLPAPPSAGRLVTCRWCAGVWIAGGVVAVRRFVPTWWDPVAKALALSSVAAVLARWED